MTFFNNCTNVNEVKSLYKKLALENHPDRGGVTEVMQAINSEYAFACAKLLKGENLTAAEVEAEILNVEAYKNAINKIINLEGIVIEVVGTWIWVTGNTRPHSEILKSTDGGKFWFASKKSAWYFRTDEFQCKNRKFMDLDSIKNKYGSKVVNGGGYAKKALSA